MGIGHFLIKSPDNTVGLVIYYHGSVKKIVFKIQDGQYVSVPNGPIYYREGYISIKKSCVISYKLRNYR